MESLLNHAWEGMVECVANRACELRVRRNGVANRVYNGRVDQNMCVCLRIQGFITFFSPVLASLIKICPIDSTRFWLYNFSQ